VIIQNQKICISHFLGKRKAQEYTTLQPVLLEDTMLLSNATIFPVTEMPFPCEAVQYDRHVEPSFSFLSVARQRCGNATKNTFLDYYETRKELILILIYLLTAIGLTSDDSSTVHIYTQTVHRTTKLTTLVRRLSGIRTHSGQTKINDELSA